MPQGKPSKWVSLAINEDINLTKAGTVVTVWQKNKSSHTGRYYISVGGISYQPFDKSKKKRASWDELQHFFMNK